MNRIFVLLLLCVHTVIFAQEVRKDTVRETDIEDIDTFGMAIELPELTIYKGDAEAMKQYMLLQNRVYKVYPYAKIAAERLTMLDKNMAKLKTKKEKKKYFKIVEDYIQNEFTEKLKKLSRKQGQILVKLINRQTGETTFDLVKEYKSGWKAFWASNTAKVFDINLKAKYSPMEVNEDYLIETILQRAFDSGRLVRQEAAKPVDYRKLNEYWIERVENNKKNKKK